MKRATPQQGFTLVEMIVSLGLFTVVVTISVGSLLVLIAANKQLQQEQNVLTNVAFALDSMTREIRTGTFYDCGSFDEYNTTVPPFRIVGNDDPLDDVVPAGQTDADTALNNATDDCPDGRDLNVATDPDDDDRLTVISFIEGGDSITGANSRIVYWYDAEAQQLYRRTGTNPPESIVSGEVLITDANFFVTGSNPLTAKIDPAAVPTVLTDQLQPTVTIVLEAASRSIPETTYTIQTTVTQRSLDI